MLAPASGISDMIIFYSHQDGLGAPNHGEFPIASSRRLLRLFVRRFVNRFRAGLGIVHQAIVAAKLRRLRQELALRADDHRHGRDDPEKDIVKFPQRPLILGDKWDF
jgi:hypothetical protein